MFKISWKSIIIKKSEKISVKHNQLCVYTNEKESLFPFDDINCIVLENNYTLITTQILAKLVTNDIFIIICDEKYDPVGITLSLNQYWQPLTVFEKQMNLTKNFKDRIKTKIIKAKLNNSLNVLQALSCDENIIKMVKNLIKTMKFGDSNNREGTVAKIFFRELYGSNFVRFADDGINSALNYGYKIIASSISRTINKYGLTNFLGIFHIGKTNPFNLAYDFIEPLRPLVDFWVSQNLESIDQHIAYHHRLQLICLLDEKVMIDKKYVTVTKAIDYMMRSFLSCLNDNTTEKLVLPELQLNCEENVINNENDEI